MFSILWLCFCMACFMPYTTTLPKSGSKECVLVIDTAEVADIRKLITMDHVNMIDLHLFSGPNSNEQLFPYLQITFVNADGREIISLLDIQYLIITWTLRAGRTRYNLHVRGSRTGCINATKNMRKNVSASLLKQILGDSRPTGYEVCYVEKKVSQLPVTRTCCKLAKNKQFVYECDIDKKGKDIFYIYFLPNIPSSITVIGFVAVFIFCCPFVETSLTYKNDKTYYYLTESTMSKRPCIFRYIISEDHGQVVSRIRRLVFVTIISILYTSHFWQIGDYLNYIFIYWAISFPFSKLLNGVVCEDDQRLRILKGTAFTCLSKFMTRYLQYDIRDLHSSHITHSHLSYTDNLLLLISLPFNIKKWQETIKKLHYVLVNAVISRWSIKNCFGSSVQRTALWLFITSVCLVYIPVVLIMIIILIITTITGYMHTKFKIVIHSDSKQATESRYQTLRHVHETVILILSAILFGGILVLSFIPFCLGLLVNIIYFIPYITVVSVFIFYSLQFWTSIENKYFALKMFIYEEYQERTSENNNGLSIQTRSKKESGMIIPVIPKELYHKIRERLLPYYTYFLFLGLQIFVILVFLTCFVYIIMVLQKNHATSFVKVITTMSISVLPYIYNSFVLKSSEEQKRASDEMLKINVKRVVDELIAEDPKFATPVLTIRPYKNDTTSVENSDIEDSNAQDETHACITEPRENIQYVTSM